MNIVFIGLGSNIENKIENIENAYKQIEKHVGDIILKSTYYFSKPFEFQSDNDFVNSVICIQSKLNPIELLLALNKIEKNLGRINKSVDKIYSDRIIDLDILYFNDIIINSPDLTIPHPHMYNRNFVLEPLNEIAGNFIDPKLNKSVSELYSEYLSNFY
jgi:2-amino-4-hydroxy-6-hydroxymethyldihydropteridine diphosphokinase